MISGITVKNFKALADFSMPMEMFTCLIGLNGAGKTTVLQVLDFIGHLACGITDFRGWEKSELITNGNNSRTITFQIDFNFNGKGKYRWSGKYNIDKQRFTEESIVAVNSDPPYYNTLLQVKENRLSYGGLSLVGPKDISDYDYKGSVLSAFKFEDSVILAVKKELQSLKSMELLSPNSLRRSSLPGDSLGIGGEGLSGYLCNLKNEDEGSLQDVLRIFYPQTNRYEIKRKKFGWKDLLLRENAFKSPISAAHINDGYLRVLAILSQRYSKANFLLFDEIENGINQELIDKLLNQLLDFNGKQVLVTTHSALVLNYLADKTAKESVVFLYKDAVGNTRAVKFFEIPKIAKKMEFMAPGQIMSQTNLIELSYELAQHEEA